MSTLLTSQGMNRINDVLRVDVDLDFSRLHQFRHASELTKEAKGGYIKGPVRFTGLPANAKIIAIVLKVVSKTQEN
jgi:hypothetical protein